MIPYIMVEPKQWSEMIQAMEENARLKAEVERLDTLCKQLGKQHSDISCENIMLRKAGDAMAADLPPFGSVKDWQAAKEGKPE